MSLYDNTTPTNKFQELRCLAAFNCSNTQIVSVNLTLGIDICPISVHIYSQNTQPISKMNLVRIFYAYTDCAHNQNETHILKKLQILKFSIKSYIYSYNVKKKSISETTNLICLSYMT
ncbi:hypothetical protein B7P43_G00945 [Cryptotermes secundus]|uniref:Uncharacterized protein n=1 Tax=Cryptotermes secundus TaxID=105785 RepID=A0A2J7PGE7_9NEOP|nr:hypothetical protein B7P43_G00945 [Cryptotermes secundus]